MKTFTVGAIILFTGCFAFAKSSFNEVRSVLLKTNPPLEAKALSEFKVYQSHKLPHYPVNMKSLFQYGSEKLVSDARRTLSDDSDYLERLPKLIHPNGICVLGTWEMSNSSGLTGAFAPGKKLFVGRISVAMQETESDQKRGFGFAGKIFDTKNPDEVVPTANFFTVDILMGALGQQFLETATTNEPELGFDFSMVGLGIRIASALSRADKNPGFRPVKNLAMLGLAIGQEPTPPHWIRISAAPETIKNHQKDFRDEVLQALKDNKELTFNVDSSNETKDRNATTGWNQIGKIKIQEAVVSYSCDRQLHFSHPRLK